MNYAKSKLFTLGLEKLVDLRYDPLGPYTHAAHETFFFDRIIGDFNFWGMKVPRYWTGKIVEIQTKEYKDGKYIKIVDKFVDFDNLNHAFEHYDKSIKRLYRDAYELKFLGIAFLEKLSDSDEKNEFKWATDKDYFKKLKIRYCQIMNDELQFNMLSKLIKKHYNNLIAK